MAWQDPYGQYSQNPYGQTQPGWQDPYAQQQQQQQQPGYGYGYYGPPGGQYGGGGGSNGAAVGALIANIASAILCCGGVAWLPGIILSAMAMSRNNTDPESSRQLTLWAWVCFGVNIVLMIVLFVVLVALGTFSESHSTTSGSSF